jgi:hypothetical protein
VGSRDNDLVVLVADADAEHFLAALLARGIARRCLRKITYQFVRESMHDARVVRSPAAALSPFARHPTTCFLVVWDHHGSGCEDQPPAAAEAGVIAALERMGVPRSRTAAVAFAPELEAALLPAWARVCDLLHSERQLAPMAKPLAPPAHDPKAGLIAIYRRLNLRANPRHFQRFGDQLSLTQLKQGDAIGRIATQLTQWFGQE